MTPLFIPLKSEFYDQFKAGTKPSELRLYGKRWNEKTCYRGRVVTLSKGYGKKNRLIGVVTGFERKFSSLCNVSQQIAIQACYGPGIHDMAIIYIEVLR